MADNNRGMRISTIQPQKLTAVINDFIIKTVNHLNKLSVNVEEKLQNFDKKLNDLEIMTTLLESKLNSLPPEITSQFPQLQQCTLDDVNPVISTSPAIISNSSVPSAPQGSSNIPPVPGTGSIPPVPGTGSIPPVPGSGTIPPVPGSGPVPSPPQSQPQPQSEGQPQPTEQPAEEEKKEEALSPQEELDKFMEEHNNQTFINLQKMLKLKIPEQSLIQKATMNGLNMDDVKQLIELWKKAHPY